MQDISSAERFNDFERAVVEAAEVEARALISGAEKERDDMLYKAQHSVAKSEYDRLMQKAEQWRFKQKATLHQEVRRRLLLYREELIKNVTQELSKKFSSFSTTKDYETFIKTKLDKYTLAQDSEISCKQSDENIFKALCKNATIKISTEIELGGFLLKQGNIMYDETVDTALNEEQMQLLSYCGLEVV